MKRWVAALVAVLFLSTATLHVFAHHDAADAGCVVCHVQRTSLPGAAAPSVVAAPAPGAPVAPASAPRLLPSRPSAAAARAPPVPTA